MSLDIPEPQVLVATNPGEWDHWVLLRRQQDAVWLALGPGLEVEVLDPGPLDKALRSDEWAHVRVVGEVERSREGQLVASQRNLWRRNFSGT